MHAFPEKRPYAALCKTENYGKKVTLSARKSAVMFGDYMGSAEFYIRPGDSVARSNLLAVFSNKQEIIKKQKKFIVNVLIMIFNHFLVFNLYFSPIRNDVTLNFFITNPISKANDDETKRLIIVLSHGFIIGINVKHK